MAKENLVILPKKITKSRLVAALLAELDAANAIVTFESYDSKFIYQGKICCELKIPFDHSFLVFKDNKINVSKIRCTCCFAGQRIYFEIEKQVENQWKLPESIELSDLRHNTRMLFSSRSYSAEIVGKRAVYYGFAIDINTEYLALELDSYQIIEIGSDVKVLIRLTNTNCDVLYNDCLVVDSKNESTGKIRVILKLKTTNTPMRYLRKFERHPIKDTVLTVSQSIFSDSSPEIQLKVENLSNAGMTTSYVNNGFDFFLAPGLIVKGIKPAISFITIWSQQGRAGIKPILASPEHVKEWFSFLNKTLPESNRKQSISRVELANLLTHSGLLKGERRLPMGREIDKHVIASNALESPLLIQRCVLANSDGESELHVSAKRISENSWFIGEGAALTEKLGDYNNMLDSFTVSMKRNYVTSNLMCRYLTAIWHYTVKSSASWGENLATHSQSRLLDSFQISISSILELEKKKGDVAVYSKLLADTTSDERRSVLQEYEAMVIDAIVGFDGTHPVFSGELKKLGPYHKVLTKIFRLNQSQLIAHRVITHNVWSSTGVTNSVFILVDKNINCTDLLQILLAVGTDEISLGTNDFLLIFDSESASKSEFSTHKGNPKRFSFLVHDLNFNREIEFIDM